MENKRENKKFYKKLMIVLLSAWLFMLIIPLNTILYDKETYVYEPQNYGFKNLAIPDLTDKEYLGDGVYRVSDFNGVTVDYNVYNGEYELNGTVINNGFISDNIFKPTLLSEELTVKHIYISGEKSIVNSNMTIQLQYNTNISSTFANLINGVTNNYDNQDRARLYSISLGTFTNYKFKLQLEKGDTATPYTVPLEPLIYHYKGGIKNA